ncbi:carbamoyltransferase family protein [Rhodovulum sulfidophilum]|uniref:carbamoyltransferase family protein n=1 Tax=Rhodovulum sulfidophilum TaxID=35806 RepID=UPI0009528618|nr:carbamoyltransferase C-terminal domain-containing protein [Rhodovulum sulfidophilum]MBL3554171.1 carbamoyl transferase [Rhodovulum sulfidophilum]OLS50122.1 carbamoyl transferase [Rhodovulum sulfidophilum]
MSSWYLGLSTSGHDPALALVDATGRVVFAEATERFMQDKRAWGVVPDHVPHLASALAAVGARPGDRIVPATSWASVKADLGLKVHDALLPATDTLWMQGLQARMQHSAGAALLRLGYASESPEPLRFDHHLCHAVAACHFTPLEEAACLVIDGEGDVGAVSHFRLAGRRLARGWRSWGPGSLGTFYGWLTGLCGFDWREGEEWKVMGLAACGRANPALVETLTGLLAVDRGRLRFADEAAIAAIRAAVAPLARAPGAPVTDAADLAAAGQAAYAVWADRVLAAIAEDGPALILSGGCALNSSYNGTIAGRTGFESVFVPPCPADDGNAIGAALLAWMTDTGAGRIPFGGGSAFLGSAPRAKTLETARHAAAAGHAVTDLAGRSAEAAAGLLAQGRILGVMRGRAEFGPRALGNRSILADPRPGDMKDAINARVKGREPYRPFAPVLAEADLAEWFERPQPSPYMSMTLPWRHGVRDRVPAVVHDDGTGRLQTVGPDSAPWMADLVAAFGRETGVPVVLNTSFNIMGKPILHSVEDALGMLATTGLDAVMIEDILIEKPVPS